MGTILTLNERAQRLADHMATTAAGLRIDVKQTAKGGRVLDCGIHSPGGLQAGLAMANALGNVLLGLGAVWLGRAAMKLSGI